jgi:hypothetical protein
MDSTVELERIRRASAAARQRIRRLESLLDEQLRILYLDPAFAGSQKKPGGHRITWVEIRVFAFAFSLASLAAFLAGFWIARSHYY